MDWQKSREFLRKFDLLILQDKTHRIFKTLHFKWKNIETMSLHSYLTQLIGEGKACTL